MIVTKLQQKKLLIKMREIDTLKSILLSTVNYEGNCAEF